MGRYGELLSIHGIIAHVPGKYAPFGQDAAALGENLLHEDEIFLVVVILLGELGIEIWRRCHYVMDSACWHLCHVLARLEMDNDIAVLELELVRT